MKSTNKQQEMYMIAKANLAVLEDRQKALELEYILNNNIANEDGSEVSEVYTIDDQEIFDKANKEVTEIIEASGLWSEIIKAREYLKVCEENLISYGLSLMPKMYDAERATLAKSVRENYTARMKMIELTLKLDVRTVKAAR